MFIVIRLNNLSFAFISFRAWDSPLITLPIDFSIKQRTNLKGWIKNTNYPRLETLHKCRKQIILSFLKIEYFHKTYELWTPKAIFFNVTFSFFMSWSIWIPLYFKVFGRRSLYFIRPRLLIFINLSIGFAMGFFLCLLNFQCWKHWTLVIDLQEVMVISCIKKNHRHFFNRAKVNLARIIRFSCWLFQPGGICPSLCWSRDMRYEQAWLFLRGYLQDKPTW